MGKGDKKTRRGKIIQGSFGKLRRKKRTPAYVPPVAKKVKKEEPIEEKVATNVVAEEVKATEKKTTAKKNNSKKDSNEKSSSKENRSKEKN